MTVTTLNKEMLDELCLALPNLLDLALGAFPPLFIQVQIVLFCPSSILFARPQSDRRDHKKVIMMMKS